MKEAIDGLLSHPLGMVLGFFSVAIMELLVFLACFELVTKYKCWSEIRKGNVAVAMATGGKIFGICNVLRFCIQAKSSVYDAMTWSIVGFILLLVAYFLFEFLTPVFSIDREIEADNRAVGLISMIISVSLSFVIGASII
ncbi:putative membrane protein [Paenibacillus barcinonensis]|nr:putative membrane protein [Paenibacillus barcinonensis]